MSRKGENIYERKDGRWEARYVKGYEPSGKIQYGSCYGRTYREAKEKAAQCRAALLNHASLPAGNGRRRFAFFCGEWLRREKENVKASTYVKYDAILAKHILPKLGGCFPLGIDAGVVEQFQRALLAEGLSVKTVRDILAVLRSVLTYTAKRLPGAVPAVEIRYPRERKKEVRVLSREEQRRLVSYLNTDMDACKFGILLALLTGVRIGELCALRWENVSLRDGTLRVEATMQRLRDVEHTGPGKTKIVIGSPKSGASIRVIPLSEDAASLCRRFDPHCPAAFLLTGTQRFMEPRQLQKRFAKYARACGLEGVHFHTIRHTFATRCAEMGFEIKSLSEILGHAGTAITLNRYVHSSVELKRENLDKLAVVILKNAPSDFLVR